MEEEMGNLRVVLRGKLGCLCKVKDLVMSSQADSGVIHVHIPISIVSIGPYIIAELGGAGIICQLQ